MAKNSLKVIQDEKTLRKWVEEVGPTNKNSLNKNEKEHFDKQTENFVADVKTKVKSFFHHLDKFIERMKDSQCYRMAFYNVNGLEKNISIVDSMLTSLDLDVLFLIETKVTEDLNTKLQNEYRTFVCKARSTRSGGLMILIKKKLFEDKHLKKEELNFSAKPGKSGKTYHESCGITLFGVRYVVVYRNNSTGSGLALVKDVLELLGNENRNLLPDDNDDTLSDEIDDNEEEENLKKEEKLEEAENNDGSMMVKDNDGSGKKFVILGDFNTSNIRWANKMKSFKYVVTDRSRASKKMIDALVEHTGCNIQYVKAPTSGRSMRPIDLLFAKRGQGVINYVFVPPFLDKQPVRDHVPVYFLVNKPPIPGKVTVQNIEEEMKKVSTKDVPQQGGSKKRSGKK